VTAQLYYSFLPAKAEGSNRSVVQHENDPTWGRCVTNIKK
jgi:hypothetical protein